MDLYIKITSGVRANDIFKLQPSITLGRSKADINLKDSKASSIHAKIIQEDGALFYLDLNSTNGSSVNGEPIKKVKLIAGLVITVGSTDLSIVSEFDIKKSTAANLSEWRESLFNFARHLNVTQSPQKIDPFTRCVQVKIKSGIQSDQTWLLGYGPRILGPMSSDVCILDDSLDDYALKISKNNGRVEISSVEENKPFLVNGQKKSTEVLKDRLDIQIGNTLLEIGFWDDETV